MLKYDELQLVLQQFSSPVIWKQTLSTNKPLEEDEFLILDVCVCFVCRHAHVFVN